MIIGTNGTMGQMGKILEPTLGEGWGWGMQGTGKKIKVRRGPQSEKDRKK